MISLQAEHTILALCLSSSRRRNTGPCSLGWREAAEHMQHSKLESFWAACIAKVPHHSFFHTVLLFNEHVSELSPCQSIRVHRTSKPGTCPQQVCAVLRPSAVTVSVPVRAPVRGRDSEKLSHRVHGCGHLLILDDFRLAEKLPKHGVPPTSPKVTSLHKPRTVAETRK